MSHEEAGTPKETDTVWIGSVELSFVEIRDVVHLFYARVQKDELLSVPFQAVHDWPEHLARLTHFWWIRLGGKQYLSGSYDPITKHYLAGFNVELLNRWLELFEQTVLERLTEEQARSWVDLVKKMGKFLASRNEMMIEAHGR
ncbi:MAG: group III truncated hemoglobin [Bdellovibrionales bacterium]|nr:group III truncated hemoglobin [Bdellovibrionales bacterium]